MNAYAPAIANPEAVELIESHQIDKLFKRDRGWFARDRVRKRLYGKGFPHPLDRGRWSKPAVLAWIAGAGSNPDNVPPNVKPRRRRQGGRAPAASGYADA